MRVCVVAAFILLTSCISYDRDRWPESLPPVEVFEEAYAEDKENRKRQQEDEYLGWVLSFYQGNLAYQSGWQDIKAYIYAAPNAELEQQLLNAIDRLGILIGSEWSKHNDVRVIDSRMLSLWGSTIQLAPDFSTQRNMVELIAGDIDLLLNDQLGEADIVETRYLDELGLEPFGDF